MWFSKDIHARGLEWKMSWQFLNVITLDHLLAWVQRLSGSIDERHRLYHQLAHCYASAMRVIRGMLGCSCVAKMGITVCC